ncbi:hypothetical protein ACQV5M_22300, partial [Leptospira sp. SA-E8]|uniref:hypothetical protein n=1 Tax=Leptospira sp. SA-E8 TaxID=3422259 RepID=UPI003EB9E3B4
MGEDTGVAGATVTGDTDFCTLPAAVGFSGGGLAGLADFAATLTDVFAACFTAGFFAGTGFLAADFG